MSVRQCTIPKNPPRWRTKDGRFLTPSEMTTAHLVNACLLMKRVSIRRKEREAYEEALTCYAVCGTLNGEEAQRAMANEAASIEPKPWTDGLPDIFDALISALEDRGYNTDAMLHEG